MAERPREGRRTTPQLAVVLDAVRNSGREHPTAEHIYDRVRRMLPSISLGTVYRNLQRLVQEGIVQSVPGRGTLVSEQPVHRQAGSLISF